MPIPIKNKFTASRFNGFQGSLVMPGDKSISHRAIMCGAIAKGVTRITNCLMGDDVKATIGAFKEMGVQFEFCDEKTICVVGSGGALSSPSTGVFLGNSGTSMRLMTGILSGSNIPIQLDGDSSLRKRPMARIAIPLNLMGADIRLSDGDVPPIRICKTPGLHSMEYVLPVASAQVKGAVLFAALFASGTTIVKENVATRDHTERMLEHFGADLNYSDKKVVIRGATGLSSTSIEIPGDLSSAAFFIVGAVISEGEGLKIGGVGLNPTRTGIIKILREMGARLDIENERVISNEPVGDIVAYPSSLEGISIDPRLVASAIDEFPIIFIAAACARGKTVLRGAEELRHKESDRLSVMARGLITVGIDVQVFDDGIEITGGEITGGEVDADGDHRVGMAFAVAALRARREIVVDNASQISTSFPNFFEVAESAGLRIR